MTLSDLLTNLLTVLPVAFVCGWGCLLLLVDLWLPASRKNWMPVLTALGMAVGIGLALSQISPSGATTPGFNQMILADGFTVFLNVLFLACGLAGIAIAYNPLHYREDHPHSFGSSEYYILMLFSISGMMLMAYATDLIIVFLALELLSIPLYVLTISTFKPSGAESGGHGGEAALKYFTLGAVSGAFVLYGVSLVFAATGATNLKSITDSLQAGAANLPLFTIGAALILAGLGFKIGLVPFHSWVPDVYDGAPPAVTAFMAVTVKAAGFAALLRIFNLELRAISSDLTPIIWGLAALTMFTGNLVAIAQSNLKRMLAYSSIAHSGYILMGLTPFGQALQTNSSAANSATAALFYLMAYAVAGLGVWGVVVALEQANKPVELNALAGLGRKHPWLGGAMAVFMLSFIGMPPTLGFMGKLYLFRTAIEGGQVGLAIVGVLTSLISAYYYLRVIVLMFMQDGAPEVSQTGWLKLVIYAAAAGAVLLTFFSAPLFDLAARAVSGSF